jgi:hypothetical protein
MFWRKKAAVRLATGAESRSKSPDAADLLLAAAQYVSIVSSGGRPDVLVARIYDPLLCSSPAGEGVCFLFESEQGISGKIYFFSSFASAWPDGEATPRPQIPTEMITNQVPSYAETLKSLLIMIPRRVDRIARATN